jgi:hypothetical protein
VNTPKPMMRTRAPSMCCSVSRTGALPGHLRHEIAHYLLGIGWSRTRRNRNHSVSYLETSGRTTVNV